MGAAKGAAGQSALHALMREKPARGFTLIEVLLVVAIVTILAGASLPIYANYQSRADLAIAAQALASAFRQAETDARASNYNSVWGVSLQNQTITLFQGTSYAGRNTTYDETTTIPVWVTASNTLEVEFAKLTGAPSAATSVTLTSQSGSTRTIAVNSEGAVSY